MKQPILFLLGLFAGLSSTSRVFGFGTAYDLGYGVIAVLAAVISLTFLHLWYSRATPLAGGMALSWLGCCGVVGYWWVFYHLGRDPEPGREFELLFLVLALYLTGALMHLRVISNAYWGGRPRTWVIVLAAVAISQGIALAIPEEHAVPASASVIADYSGR